MKDDMLMFQEDDRLLFAEEETVCPLSGEDKWKVLIVDDEKEVHNITKLVLNDFQFDEKELLFLSAYSSEEAKEIAALNEDLAVILLDVVMEKEDSGLDFVHYIRKELKNNLVRIILRTGQPGQAPEKKVIIDYDINDYKEKAELTAQKLFTCMVTSVRGYRDLTVIDTNKRGLEKIIEASSTLFEIQSMKKFTSGVLEQLTSILNLHKNALYCKTSSFAATKEKDLFYILAATGDYSNGIDKTIGEGVSAEVLKQLDRASKEQRSIYNEKDIVIYFKSDIGSENMIYLERTQKLNDIDIDLIEIFSSNVSIAFDNVYLNREVESTQREIIFTLGEISEARSKETSNHVKRVSEYSRLLALKYGLTQEEAEIIRMASPMHDIGKLAVPDEILNKPGKLTAEEFEIIKQHSIVGYEMLRNSNREVLRTAAIIAYEHHEKYNGKGYPRGITGDKIHLYGRITAVADVFDALFSDRVYKKAWSMEAVIELFKKERGQHFDPVLTDIILDNFDEFVCIKQRFKDV
jgi:response regulator RpfG family c-di-GMP phosphodiesterase